MAQVAQRARWGGTASLWGGLTGLLLALIVLGARLVGGGLRVRAALTGAQVGPLWLRALVVLIGLLAFFLAGFFAARTTRLIEAGIVAGLLAGAISGAAVALATLVNAGGTSARVAGRLATRFPRLAIGGGIARGLLELIIVALVATGVGALGGLAGRGRRQPLGGSPYIAPPSYPGAQGQWWPPATSGSGSQGDDTVVMPPQVTPTPPFVDDAGAPPTFQ